jgi:hypothetical protein
MATDWGYSEDESDSLERIADLIDEMADSTSDDEEIRAISVDSSGNTVASRQGNWASVNHGQDLVSTSGTSVALNGGTSLSIPDGASLTVRADSGNGGNIYVGDSSVSSSDGFVLTSGDSVSVQVDDVSDINIDSDNDNEGVSWIVEST